MARATVETVDQVARLAQLTLSEEERQLFTRQLDAILAWAESLQALDTRDVAPMTHALAVETWREDAAGGSLEHDRALTGAPDAADGLFRVPRIIG